ncbi:uncharacterized protein LOC100834915 isoform X2 [Brachypodium distachyon]|uniref:uncharacterized protein LOC100834915 isoform X2 n=1 Tax=Brachypodium distachyon TaxID=15368 RepID=UPI000D0CEF93|nr:uncharacterized protein LOC100834915 isoform X2 [Brachypodium distachyon]|eukprot:XP_024315558.1 uncharacterized protein LOC100834915 isoform X2 [Brachypodium distachyon]
MMNMGKCDEVLGLLDVALEIFLYYTIQDQLTSNQHLFFNAARQIYNQGMEQQTYTTYRELTIVVRGTQSIILFQPCSNVRRYEAWRSMIVMR